MKSRVLKVGRFFRMQPLQHIGLFIGDLISPLWEKTNSIEKFRRRQRPFTTCEAPLWCGFVHLPLWIQSPLPPLPFCLLDLQPDSSAPWQVFPYRVHSACLTRTAVLENSASNHKMRSHSVLLVVGYEGGATVTLCAALGRSAWTVSYCKPLQDGVAPRNSGFLLKIAYECRRLEYSKMDTLQRSPGFTLEVIHAAAFS